MKNSLISENKTFIITEIGNNHEGNYILAKMILQQIKLEQTLLNFNILPEKFFLKKNK